MSVVTCCIAFMTLQCRASPGLAAVDCIWNLMAHAQKPDFVFRRNGRVHLNRRERQFSRLLAAELCASAVVMLDTPCSEVVWRYWLQTPFASFHFNSPSVRHRVSLHFNWTLVQAASQVVQHRWFSLEFIKACLSFFIEGSPRYGFRIPVEVRRVMSQ